MSASNREAHRRMAKVAVSDYTLSTALGIGRAATADALRDARTGLAKQSFMDEALGAWLGLVEGIEEQRLPAELADFDCRNNRLAWLALHADSFADRVARARDRYGASRVGVFIGTSTSGILQTELAYRRRDGETGAFPSDFHYAQTQNTWSVADFTRHVLDLKGPAFVVSTACSSSAKVYANAARLMALGLIDAAVVGGVDTLCLTTLYGFNSLELISPEICRPWDAERRGLSLGEGAAFALLEREAAAGSPAAWLLGVGESSDGFHMSSPHPEGAGAARAIRDALNAAGLQAGDVDYLNLHGTGTHGNDAAEDLAVFSVFGTEVPCSSTKGATGHTLGAAGGVEAAISMLALQHGLMPGGLNLVTRDPEMRCDYLSENRHTVLDVVASNSFGFGGTNACLVFGRAA
ncbi:beta-ketoacyl-[acyl-carrier-protein] synthase family protein [soil metagenome]